MTASMTRRYVCSKLELLSHSSSKQRFRITFANETNREDQIIFNELTEVIYEIGKFYDFETNIKAVKTI